MRNDLYFLYSIHCVRTMVVNFYSKWVLYYGNSHCPEYTSMAGAPQTFVSVELNTNPTCLQTLRLQTQKQCSSAE